MPKNTLSSDLSASERAAMNTNGSVVLVEDDAGLAHALITLLEFDQYEVVHFSSGERFLDDITSQDSQMTSTTCCVLLDLNLNEKRDGLQIFKEAKKKLLEKLPPVVFLTGNGELEIGLEAMRSGAFDFLTKPAKAELLLSLVRKAHVRHAAELIKSIECSAFVTRYESLTDKQRDVFKFLVQGLANKDIAEHFQTSVRTVEIHRSSVLEKMGNISLVEIGRMYEKFKHEL
ncbi:response regulator [Burkholderiaceae bacterium]|nr:response regulator [Burkholderiaceae bacterium]